MSLAYQLFSSPGHIRSRLFRDLVLLVLFTVGLLILVNWFLIGELKRELAGSQVATATALVRDEVRNLINPVEQQLLITRVERVRLFTPGGNRCGGRKPGLRLARPRARR